MEKNRIFLFRFKIGLKIAHTKDTIEDYVRTDCFTFGRVCCCLWKAKQENLWRVERKFQFISTRWCSCRLENWPIRVSHATVGKRFQN